MKVSSIIIPAVAVGLLALGGTLGASQVVAQENTTYPPIIQKLVERFNLNADEVKQVFDEERAQHQQEMQTRFEERLGQLVSEGNLTEAQKQAILDKAKELEQKRQQNQQDWKNMTQEERRAAGDQQRTDLQNWAQENGIDLKQIPMFLGFGRHLGFGLRHSNP